MDIFKEYIYELIFIAFEVPYLILCKNIIPKLKHYLILVTNVKFKDGAYHIYYGEMKKIIDSFSLHWTEMMDAASKEADELIHTANREKLLGMVDKTIFSHHSMRTEFHKDFLPVKNDKEKEMFENFEKEFEIYIGKLQKMKDDIRGLDKKEKIQEFVTKNFPLSVARKNKFFEFTNKIISNYLIQNRVKIRISLEETLKRVSRNLNDIESQRIEYLTGLHEKLYEKNKERLHLTRKDRRPSIELAEVEKAVEIIKDKIVNTDYHLADNLEEQNKFWKNQLLEYKKIEETLDRIKEEETKLSEQHNLFKTMKDTEIPPSKRKCWESMEDRFQEKWRRLNELKLKAGKAMFTFFSVRGADRMYYTDHIGSYFVDSYGHQVYIFNYGLDVYHVNCENEFFEVDEHNNYYYDNAGGRYMIKGDEKIYQVAPCCSTYKLENDIFVKQTQDSEAKNTLCRMAIKDPHDRTVLPLTKTVQIKGTLDPETVEYLWNSVGHILPKALFDVGELQPKNPIHVLAHKLLFHKYRKTQTQLENAKAESMQFREKIYQDRKNAANAAYKDWKSKQVKPRKPEESDDAWERSIYDANKDREQLIISMNNEDN